MFEHIHLKSIQYDTALTPSMSSSFKERYEATTSELAAFYEDHAEEVDYFIIGDSKMLHPFPPSSHAQKNLLFLQAFGLIDAQSSYYTKRTNYQSFLLSYTYGGEGFLEYEGKEYHLCEGYGFLIDCRKPHFYRTKGTHWYTSTLHFDGHNADWLYQMFSNDNTVMFYSPPNNSFQKNLEEMLLACQTSSPYREVETSHLLEKLILDIVKIKNKDQQTIPDYILYLQKYMESNFTKHLSLDELSAFANISKYHLAREFKKYTGFTINEYLIILRLEHAKFYLANTALPIGEISQLVGFSNYVNFFKLFKARFEMTPNQYRG